VNRKSFHKRYVKFKSSLIHGPKGKITIAETLGLSKLIFVSACIHTPPHYLDITNKMINDFVWNNKKPKMKRDTLIVPKERGGLDLPEFQVRL